jgi:tetratricopeptide (TPR) repeat protein
MLSFSEAKLKQPTAMLASVVLMLLLSVGNAFCETELPQETVAEVRANPNYKFLIGALSEEGRSSVGQGEIAEKAWSLGLVARARAIWEETLKARKVEGVERARTALSLAILELQEANFSKARTIAEEVALELRPSELRAQLWLLIAEAAKAEKALESAEKYYMKAVEEAEGERKAEAKLLLAQCQYDSQKFKEAKETLVTISSSSAYAPNSLKLLTAIDFRNKNYKSVIVWISEGRKKYSEQFDGEEIRYQEIVSMIETNRLREAKELLASFANNFSEESDWFVLAKATVVTKEAETELLDPSFGKDRG